MPTCMHKIPTFIRPIGSKFEMVRPYYRAKCAHIHTPPFPPPSPCTPLPAKYYALKLLFLAVLMPLSLNPNDSVAAVTLVNEALLSRHVLVFVVVTARLFTICWLAILSKFMLRRGLAFSPQQNIFDDSCLPRPLREILEQELDIPYTAAFKFAPVGWPNIGPAAAAPAGPVPTALQYANMHTQHTNM